MQSTSMTAPNTMPTPPTETSSARWQESPIWDPRTGRFNAPRLQLALVLRGVTPEEFAQEAGVSRTSVYKALQGLGVRNRTAMRILGGLAQLRPRFPLPSE